MNDLRVKNPVEIVPITFDVSNELTGGESVLTAELNVRALNGFDTTPTNRVSPPVYASTKVHFMFMEGKLGEDYYIECKFTTTTGQIIVMNALQRVRDAQDS